MSNSSNNKRIAKNTLFLYLRMIVVIIIGLYTSRVILQTLGVEDYGIYNLVGGIVSMLSFLNSAMVGASQRFISYELGCNNIQKLKKVFATSIIAHCTLAVVILIIGETIGLWFVNTQLNINADRMIAANWVYQCSIGIFLLTIVSVPFNACIVAHERMKAFAYVSILEAVLKLLIVYVLLIVLIDKLITYSILMLCTSTVTSCIYVLYCRHNFAESRTTVIGDKRLFREMFAFTSWSIIGNFGFTFRDQGSNIILNLFYGTTLNAARGIAQQVNGIISNFAGNFIMALNPQITKQYANGKTEQSVKLVYTGSRFSFFLLSIITIPFFINIDYLLKIWLGSVPEYTGLFLRLVMISSLIGAMANPIVTALQATGKIKIFQIMICVIMLSELPCAYLILKLGGAPYTAMYPTILITLIALFARFIILKKMIPAYSLKFFSFSIVFRNVLIAFASFIVSQYVRDCFDTSFLNFFITAIVSFVITVILIYIFGLNSNERNILNSKLKQLINRPLPGKIG